MNKNASRYISVPWKVAHLGYATIKQIDPVYHHQTLVVQRLRKSHTPLCQCAENAPCKSLHSNRLESRKVAHPLISIQTLARNATGGPVFRTGLPLRFFLRPERVCLHEPVEGIGAYRGA